MLFDYMPFPPLHQGGSASSIGDLARFGVVTVSDRASDGRYEDLSGPAVVQFFDEAIESQCVIHCSTMLVGVYSYFQVGSPVPLHSRRTVGD